MIRRLVVGLLALLPASVALQRAEAQVWPETFRSAPCMAVPMRVDGDVLTACGGRFDLRTGAYVRSPYEVIATIGDAALVAPDADRRGGGLEVQRAPAGAEPGVGAMVANVDGPGATTWALSPDRSRIATVSLRNCNDEGVCIAEVVERSVPELRELGRTALPRPPDALVYTARGLADIERGSLRLVSGAALGRFEGMPRAQPVLAFSGDGSLVAYIAGETTLVVARTETGAIVARTPARAAERVAMSASGRRIGVALRDETIVFELSAEGSAPRRLRVVARAPHGQNELAVTDNALITVHDDVLVVRVEGGRARAPIAAAPRVALPPASSFVPYRDGSAMPAPGRIAMLAPLGRRQEHEAPPATVTIEVLDARELAGIREPAAWAAAAAERWGPLEPATTPTARASAVRVTSAEPARVDAEIDGYGNGCDPWPVWIRLARRGDHVIRIELTYDFELRSGSPRVREWQRVLRLVDVTSR